MELNFDFLETALMEEIVMKTMEFHSVVTWLTAHEDFTA
jgi:hypothetical protein